MAKSRIKSVSKKGADWITLSKVFARNVWDERPHICEECGRYLGDEFDGMQISHILPGSVCKAAYHDPENVNILCRPCHREWENGSRSKMKIYEANQEKIANLRRKYFWSRDNLFY